MHVMRIFYPPLSAVVHGALLGLFIASVVFQAGSDMTDPSAPQPGPPWYITKSCSVAYYPSDIGYCQQAKSLFAVCIIMWYVFRCHVVVHCMTELVLIIFRQRSVFRTILPGRPFIFLYEGRTRSVSTPTRRKERGASSRRTGSAGVRGDPEISHVRYADDTSIRIPRPASDAYVATLSDDGSFSTDGFSRDV